jgi:metal-responsive CopG/Arc/MetJ family transcriptional regulator
MKRKSIWLTEQQIAELERLAKGTGLKPSEIIRRAIDNYLEEQTKKGVDREI